MPASVVATPFLGTTRIEEIDFLLREVAKALQLSPQQRALAEIEYDNLNKWLNRTGGGLWVYEPLVYPQGSMSYGTTVRPRLRDEFDLDCVVELPYFNGTSSELFNLLHRDLSLCSAYKGHIEKLKRCVRIIIERLFYIDVLPGRHDVVRGGTCIEIPDRKLRDWCYGNPKGFRDWFEDCCQRAVNLVLKARAYEPLPEEESVELKAVLKQVVQLLKRQRDIAFDDEDLAPRSIVLTTLAGDVYQGEQSLFTALSSVLDAIQARIDAADGEPLELCNPTNEDECFSEALDADPARYYAFVDWIARLRSRVVRLSELALPELGKELGSLFGETVANRAVTIFAKSMQAASESRSLRIGPAAQLTIIPSAGTVVPQHRFYGRR